jgi:hypothetical protein
MISIVRHTEFKKMSVAAVQELLAHRQVVVTGIPGRQEKFDMAGLRTLSAPNKVVHIHGQ